MVAGNGSGDSPGNDGSSLVRAPTRTAYSFADTDRAVVFPIRLDDEAVAALVSPERVVAAASFQGVVAGAAIKRIVALVSREAVVACVSCDRVVALAPAQGVVAGAPHQPVVALASVDAVRPVARLDDVVAGCALDGVVAPVPEEHVAPEPADHHVLRLVAFDVVVVVAGDEHRRIVLGPGRAGGPVRGVVLCAHGSSPPVRCSAPCALALRYRTLPGRARRRLQRRGGRRCRLSSEQCVVNNRLPSRNNKSIWPGS